MIRFLFDDRARSALAVTLTAAFIILLLWFGISVLLEIFAGVLLAVFLRGLANLLGKHSDLSPNAAYGIVLIVVAVFLCAFVLTLFREVASQVDKMMLAIPQALGELRVWLDRYEWGRWILAERPLQSVVANTNAGLMVYRVLDWGAAVVLVLFVGVYMGAEPTLYREGFVTLIPPEHCELASNVLERSYETLWWWLIGRLIAMTAVGMMNWIGLALLGVPLPLTLGLIAGLLTFIPNLGAIIAVIPAGLLALTVSPRLVLWVVVLHFVLQGVEGYFITPFVQKRTIWMPPALLISVQILAASLVGFLGLTFAVPIAAVGIVLVKMLYIRDTLGEPIKVPEKPAP